MLVKKHKIIDVKPGVFESDKANSPEPKQRRNYILDIIFSTCVDSTAHGFGPIIRRDNIVIRLFWIVCLLASAGVCIWMISMSIMSYFDYETVSRTEKVHLTLSEFPAVTICNTNTFLTNESLDFINNILVEAKLIDVNNYEESFKYLTGFNYQFLRYISATNALNPAFNDSFRKSLAPDITDMLFSCSFNLQDCKVNDFSWFFDTYYGNCFTFNSGKYLNGSDRAISTSPKPGAINGLRFELYLYEPTNLSSLSVSSGVRIVVHNQTHKPAFDEAMFVPVGSDTSIDVTRIFTSLLEKPYSDCESNIDMNHPSRLVKAILATGHAYTQLDCFYACFQDFIIDQCGCFDFTSLLPISTFTSRNITPCLNLTQIDCDVKKFIEFFTSYKESVCGDDCPLECESVKYNLFSSSTDYPTRPYASGLSKNPTIQAKYASDLSKLSYDSLKRNIVQIWVGYRDLGYDRYVEDAKTEVIDIVSNIGGTLGLFLGMSFLSIAEILDILLQILFYNRNIMANKISNI